MLFYKYDHTPKFIYTDTCIAQENQNDAGQIWKQILEYYSKYTQITAGAGIYHTNTVWLYCGYFIVQ